MYGSCPRRMGIWRSDHDWLERRQQYTLEIHACRKWFDYAGRKRKGHEYSSGCENSYAGVWWTWAGNYGAGSTICTGFRSPLEFLYGWSGRTGYSHGTSGWRTYCRDEGDFGWWGKSLHAGKWYENIFQWSGKLCAKDMPGQWGSCFYFRWWQSNRVQRTFR